MAGGAATLSRFHRTELGPPAPKEEAGGAQAQLDQGVKGQSRRRGARERGDQDALRADFQGVMRLASLHRRVGKGAQSGARGSVLSCAFAHAHIPALSSSTWARRSTKRLATAIFLPAPLPTLRVARFRG